MKATEQYFPVVLFIMLYKMVLTFETVDKICHCAWQMISLLDLDALKGENIFNHTLSKGYV